MFSGPFPGGYLCFASSRSSSGMFSLFTGVILYNISLQLSKLKSL